MQENDQATVGWRFTCRQRRNAHLVSLHEVGWHCILWPVVLHFLISVLLFMHIDGLLHQNLLLVALFGEQLALQSQSLLGILGPGVHFTGSLLPLPLLMIQTFTIPFLEKLYVLVLRHGDEVSVRDCATVAGVHVFTKR